MAREFLPEHLKCSDYDSSIRLILIFEFVLEKHTTARRMLFLILQYKLKGDHDEKVFRVR